MDRRLVAGGAGIALAAAGALLAIQARRKASELDLNLGDHAAAIKDYVTSVMNDPDRADEANRINRILQDLDMHGVLSGPGGSELQGMPRWQLIQLRFGTLAGGRPGSESLSLMGRFLGRIQLAGLSVAELALSVAAAVGYTMVNDEPPPQTQIDLIDELDLRLQAASESPPPRPGQITLQFILVTMAKDIPMAGEQSLTSYLRSQLQNLRSGRLDPSHAPNLESRLLDIAGEAGKHGI